MDGYVASSKFNLDSPVRASKISKFLWRCSALWTLYLSLERTNLREREEGSCIRAEKKSSNFLTCVGLVNVDRFSKRRKGEKHLFTGTYP
ncbi:hypothetical protein M513_05066 [Trichuris suis]|uniref:Uncharacterized protein n=1 Tax=Trichuris suis TaxID=68888 RepID=A0A085MA01_9BILA|nr:hypothetical protein M513_05066 [Trichuris suis]